MQGLAPSTARNLVPPARHARGFMIEKTEYMDKQKFPEGADARLGAGDKDDCGAQLHLGFIFAQSCHSTGLVFTLTVFCLHENIHFCK